MPRAETKSLTIMIQRRSHLSANNPARGENKATGKRAATPAQDKASTEPVVSEIHHISTNWVKAVPKKETD